MQDADQAVGNLIKAILANLDQGNLTHLSVQGIFYDEWTVNG
jgi:hypothetical protein